MRTLRQIMDRVAELMGIIGGILMALLTVVVFLAVVSRYFFDLPIQSTGELSGLLFAWLVFLTAISVTHNDDNIAVTYFRGLLPVRVQKAVRIGTKLITLAFVVLVLISSAQLTLAVANQPLPSLRISGAWLNGSVTVAFSVLAVLLLVRFALSLLHPESERDGESSEDEALEVRGVE